MKDFLIAILTGILISKSDIWVYADRIDLFFTAIAFAATTYIILVSAGELLRSRNMMAWRRNRIIRKIHQLQNPSTDR